MVFSKAALLNLYEPIHCDNAFPYKNMSTSQYIVAACQQLKQPQFGEAQLFQPGMSLLDLMAKYVTFQPYSMYKNWTTGFCWHGDWLWGYFVNNFNVARPFETKNDPFMREVTNARTHPYMNSAMFWTKPQVGGCLNHAEKCTKTSGVCHWINPERAFALHSQVQESMPVHAFPQRQNHSRKLVPVGTP